MHIITNSVLRDCCIMNTSVRKHSNYVQYNCSFLNQGDNNYQLFNNCTNCDVLVLPTMMCHVTM